MASVSALVLELLTFTEQVEKLKIRPAFTVSTEYFAAHQSELKGLPEIRFNIQPEGEDVWLSIPRLPEISPPQPDQKLIPWMILHKGPAKAPELKPSVESPDAPETREQLRSRTEIRKLFEAYIEKLWTPWALAELPRRKTILRYNQLFALYQAMASDGAETPVELVWGMGVAIWEKEGARNTLKYPLITQACEIILNRLTFELEIRPRRTDPRIELDCYCELEIPPGVQQLETFWKKTAATREIRVNPFEVSTFEPVLKEAAARLDPNGSYVLLDNDAVLPPHSNNLQITSAWVLFARRRTATAFLEDVDRLKRHVHDSSSLPPVIRSFVERGGSDVQPKADQPVRGLLSSNAPTGAAELYFPLPYNDEQVSIHQKLEHDDGVVVQGPPGTGKTHTIANIISHYLAMGKRVLVSSKGETALTEVVKKLPERIRPLAVALLSNEREGMRAFEHSIQTIAATVSGLDPGRTEKEIVRLEEQLNRIHTEISNIDLTIRQHASQHMRAFPFRGTDSTPAEIARYVLENENRFSWFDDDLTVDATTSQHFNDTDIDSLRQARIRVGEDLCYLDTTLPIPDALPAWQALSDIHRDIVQARSIDTDVQRGAIPPLVDSQPETYQSAIELLAFLNKRLALQAKIAAATGVGLDGVSTRISGLDPDDILLVALQETCEEVNELDHKRRSLVAKAIVLPWGAEDEADFLAAVERLKDGKSAFALPVGKAAARKMLASVTVLGSPPSAAEDWEHVHQAVNWRTSARTCLARWNSVAGEFGIEAQNGDLDSAFRRAAALQAQIMDLRSFAFEYNAKLPERIHRVFGSGKSPSPDENYEAFLARVATALQMHISRRDLASAVSRLEDIRQQLAVCSGPVVEELNSFLATRLGDEREDELGLQRHWLSLQSELIRLGSLTPLFGQIRAFTAKIEDCGAPRWANRIRTVPAKDDHDPIVPADWRDAWEWRRGVALLNSIEVHHELRNLFAERRARTSSLARCYQEIVAERSWLSVFRQSPPDVRQDLQKYLNAVQAMGTGAGLRAERYRKHAQEAMRHAYRAVPCWVLPQWRVCETIPSEAGLFDLVIIDEASQSDISALPVLLRGKKLLIVGDHKQVSPSAIGVPEERIRDLNRRFLTNQPFYSEMTPEKSIYDLARVVFAGNSVMLKEHFRCVPAIIEFSNREFYQNEIKPLRIPHADERLDPPLIDVYVKGGFRKGDINEPEARAILLEIQAILGDRTLAGRSIGVVTLLGTEQAAHIQKLITAHISPVDVVERSIAVGPPPVFQGRERDLMLISMVLGPGDQAAQNRADQHQRFNVALSRARDRQYLFHSVDDTAFAEDTPNGLLLRHFREPFRKANRSSRVLRERCESDLERAMFDELTKRGYRFEPQVTCGGFRIDFVVEGSLGRRLAIECDGDRFHGPEQWIDDMMRQRILERAGWTFWRCFASTFFMQREKVLTDLFSTMSRLGIEPLGSDDVDKTAWTSSKVVDPFAVSDEETEVNE
jgi:very-short-patch-repair endonuclease